MVVRDYKFRELNNKMCYIDEIPNQVIFDEFLSDDNVTGFIGYGYVDHLAGFTFETMACARKMGDDIIVYPGNNFMTFKYRMRNIMHCECIVLDEEKYDFSDFQTKVERIQKIYNSDVEIKALRDIEEIDGSRSNEFPDDVLVTLYKENVKAERAWFRLEGLNEQYIQGRLLHDLTNKNYGLETGDVANLALMEDDQGKIHLICFIENMVEKALTIATQAHLGQKDKSGVDYIQHPITVASFVESEEEKIVAYLHDVVEDSDITLDDLREMGFNEEIVFAIDCITKKENETLENYYNRVIQSDLAYIVKMADIKHNSDITRFENPTQKDIDRSKKYLEKSEILKQLYEVNKAK